MDTCAQMISRLRLLLYSGTSVLLRVVQALFVTFERCALSDLMRLAAVLTVLWSENLVYYDQVHALVTARMIEFLVRGASNLGHGASRILDSADH